MAQRPSDTQAKSSTTGTLYLPKPIRFAQVLMAIPDHSSVTPHHSTQSNFPAVTNANRALAQKLAKAQTEQDYLNLLPDAHSIFSDMTYLNQSSGCFDDTYYYAMPPLIVTAEFETILITASEGLYLTVNPRNNLILQLCRLYALLKLGKFVDAQSAFDDIIKELSKVAGLLPTFDLTPYKDILNSIWTSSVTTTVQASIEAHTKTTSQEQKYFLQNAITCVNQQKLEMASLYFAKINADELNREDKKLLYFNFAVHAMQHFIQNKHVVTAKNSVFSCNITASALSYVTELHYDRVNVQMTFCQSIIDSFDRDPIAKIHAITLLQEVFLQLCDLSLIGAPHYSILPELMLMHKLTEIETELKKHQANETNSNSSSIATSSSSVLTNTINQQPESLTASLQLPTEKVTEIATSHETCQENKTNSSSSSITTSSSCVLTNTINQQPESLTASLQLPTEKPKDAKIEKKTIVKPTSQKSLKHMHAKNSKKYQKEARRKLQEQKIQEKSERAQVEALQKQKNSNLLAHAANKNSTEHLEHHKVKRLLDVSITKSAILVFEKKEKYDHFIELSGRKIAMPLLSPAAIKKPHEDEASRSSKLAESVAEKALKKQRNETYDHIIEHSGRKIATTSANDIGKRSQSAVAEVISITKKLNKQKRHRPLFLPLQAAISYVERDPAKINSQEKVISIITQTIPVDDLKYIHSLHNALLKEGFQLNLGRQLVAKLGILLFHPDDPSAQNLVVDHIELFIQLQHDAIPIALMNLLVQFKFSQESVLESLTASDWQYSATTPHSRLKLKLLVHTNSRFIYEPNPLNTGQAQFDCADGLPHYTFHLESAQQKFTLSIKANENFIAACMDPIYAIALPPIGYKPHIAYCAGVIHATVHYGACKTICNTKEFWEHLKNSLHSLFAETEEKAYHFICSEIYALNAYNMLHGKTAQPFLKLFFFIALNHLTAANATPTEKKYFWSEHLTNCLQAYAKADFNSKSEAIMREPLLAQDYDSFKQQLFMILELAIQQWSDVQQFNNLLKSGMQPLAEQYLNTSHSSISTSSSSQANNLHGIFHSPTAHDKASGGNIYTSPAPTTN